MTPSWVGNLRRLGVKTIELTIIIVPHTLASGSAHFHSIGTFEALGMSVCLDRGCSQGVLSNSRGIVAFGFDVGIVGSG